MKAVNFARQTANLILAPAMWVTSSLGFFTTSARTAAEFSDLSDNLLVPFSAAFSIWFPIFVGCIAYGIVQALPQNRNMEVFRQSGWWTAGGFALICGWALITAYVPLSVVQWGTALIFIPAVAALVVGAIRLSTFRASLTSLWFWTAYIPISLIAGWCSIAVFLNWTPIAYDLFANGEANILSSILMLAAALGFIIATRRKMPRNLAYLFPPVWGLGFLAFRHIGLESATPEIGWAAILGMGLLVLTAIAGRRQKSEHPRKS